MTNTLSWIQVGSLILAFLILLVFMPWGLSQPVGDFRTLCGVLSVGSFCYLAGFLFAAPKN